MPGRQRHGDTALPMTLDPPAGLLQILDDPADAIGEGTNGEAANEFAF